MKYKLKEHVTKEMLVAVGFDMDTFAELTHGTRNNEIGEIYIILSRGTRVIEGDELFIQWDDDENDHLDITPYIQDLIDLDYVEVVE